MRDAKFFIEDYQMIESRDLAQGRNTNVSLGDGGVVKLRRPSADTARGEMTVTREGDTIVLNYADGTSVTLTDI